MPFLAPRSWDWTAGPDRIRAAVGLMAASVALAVVGGYAVLFAPPPATPSDDIAAAMPAPQPATTEARPAVAVEASAVVLFRAEPEAAVTASPPMTLEQPAPPSTATSTTVTSTTTTAPTTTTTAAPVVTPDTTGAGGPPPPVGVTREERCRAAIVASGMTPAPGFTIGCGPAWNSGADGWTDYHCTDMWRPSTCTGHISIHPDDHESDAHWRRVVRHEIGHSWCIRTLGDFTELCARRHE